MTVSCNALLPQVVNYGLRLQSASGRTMSGPRGTLSYLLASDPAFAVAWPEGHTVSDVILLLLPLFPVARQHSVYGRLATGQKAGPGSYSESLMVVLTF